MLKENEWIEQAKDGAYTCRAITDTAAAEVAAAAVTQRRERIYYFSSAIKRRDGERQSAAALYRIITIILKCVNFKNKNEKEKKNAEDKEN